jgi:hypothetical protein
MRNAGDLLWGIGFELTFAAALLHVPQLRDVFGTAPLAVADLMLLRRSR